MTEQNGSSNLADVISESIRQEKPQKSTADGVKVPVKFNKQVKMLDITEAATLAQKGMKFDMISADFERIKKLALKKGKSIGEYVSALEQETNQSRIAELSEKCGGDEALARHFLELEEGKGESDIGEKELYEQFPEITDVETLPEEVLTSARLRGTSLLDEYLRYRRRAELEAIKEAQAVAAAQAASIGAFGSVGTPDNPERSEFIRALWEN